MLYVITFDQMMQLYSYQACDLFAIMLKLNL